MAVRSKRPQMSTSIEEFQTLVKTYENKEAAYSDLGIGQRIRSHKASIHTTKTQYSTLFCKLWEKGCPWQGVLSYNRPGTVDLLSRGDETKDHKHDIDELVGKTGCKSLEQKKYLQKQFQGATRIQPRTALRALKIDTHVAESDKAIEIKDVQRVKKLFTCSDARARQTLGEIATAIIGRTSVPEGPHMPFFTVAIIRKGAQEGDMTYMNLVATTKNLMTRFTRSSVMQLDGGYKYNILGYPCTFFGCASSDMVFAPTGILLSTGTSTQQIQEACTLSLSFPTLLFTLEGPVGTVVLKYVCGFYNEKWPVREVIIKLALVRRANDKIGNTTLESDFGLGCW